MVLVLGEHACRRAANNIESFLVDVMFILHTMLIPIIVLRQDQRTLFHVIMNRHILVPMVSDIASK